jgi:hypothetical protein
MMEIGTKIFVKVREHSHARRATRVEVIFKMTSLSQVYTLMQKVAVIEMLIIQRDLASMGALQKEDYTVMV